MPDETERFWWACGPGGWAIETWAGDAKPENVITIGYVRSLDAAESVVRMLNMLDPTPHEPS